MSKVILISGFARAGKDTLAKAMNTYNPKFMPMSFAEPLKRACNAAFRELEIEIDFFKEEDKCENREVLIEVGKAARKKYKAVFAKILAKKVRSLMELGYNPVITDWRYVNEHEVLVEEFGAENIITVMVERGDGQPAHQEERKSISEILESTPLAYRERFDDGAMERLVFWGREIAEKSL